MRTSESIDQVAGALASAQGEYTAAIKNKKNPHFGNWYADLSSIFEATRPALSKHGLALAQFPEVVEGRVKVISLLAHKSGQWLEDTLSLKPAGDTPQAVGSAITYAKRYGAEAILGISGEDEDDGNAAQGHDSGANQKQTTSSNASKQIIAKPINPKSAITAPTLEKQAAPNPVKRPFDMHNGVHVLWFMKKLEEHKIAQGDEDKTSRDALINDFHGKDMATELDDHLEKAIHGEY